MKLAALLDGLALGRTEAATDIGGRDLELEIQDLALDSRNVQPGGAFLAVAGERTHGLAHLAQALQRGAHAVLWEVQVGLEAPRLPAGVVGLPVQKLRAQVGALADRFFGSPSRDVTVAGVTGTNGKTTSAFVLAQALSRCGRPAAYLGTLGFGPPGNLRAGAHTTPDAVTLHRCLREASDRGFGAVAMEVSSHALAQGRLDGVRVHTAVFTNLTRDHLDYHGSMEAYGAAKASLFQRAEIETAVLNANDGFALELAEKLAGDERRARDALRLVLTARGKRVSRPQAEFLVARRQKASPGSLSFELETSWGRAAVRAPFIGEFNVDNLLGVLGVLLAWDVPLQDAVHALASCSAPPGRMQMLGGRGLPLVVVDYAHTPDALAKALTVLREHGAKRLWCVFGCGGDRDTGKRPLMGTVAERLADEVILTDDNSRSELRERIVAEIVTGFARRQPRVIHDRGGAISAAVGAAEPTDAVLIAGKGHEDYQIVGSERLPFSDAEAAAAALAARSGIFQIAGAQS